MVSGPGASELGFGSLAGCPGLAGWSCAAMRSVSAYNFLFKLDTVVHSFLFKLEAVVHSFLFKLEAVVYICQDTHSILA